MTRRSDKLYLLPPMILGMIVFLVGINWGLPSRRVDPLLFGDHPVWSGEEIVKQLGEAALAGGERGSDVDPNPERIRPVVVNDSDAKRAEILVRYRLYSYQPDEMITFRALQAMPKTHGDPRLYQYGGLWIYPVGALLKLASWVHLVDLQSDLAFYLDHPEAFGRFYIVARLYAVAFAMLGIWATYWLARKMNEDPIIGMLASIGFVLLPVVINMAHEAKPHLPAAVLAMCAIIAATKYVEGATRKTALIAGALCGASFGMVLTGAMSFILLPVMCWMRWRARPPLAASRIKNVALDFLLALLVGVGVYCITNPFVVIHLVGDRTILESNLANSQAMYRPMVTLLTLKQAAYLIFDGATPLFACAGGAAILLLSRRNDLVRKLLLIVSLPIIVQFVMLATDKPGEYARFGLFIDIMLMLCGVMGIAGIVRPLIVRRVVIAFLCGGCCIWSIGYVWHFGRDSIARTPRMIVGERLEALRKKGAREIAVYNDPAPFALPPVNLFKWRIMLLDPGAAPRSSVDILIKPVDEIPKTNMPMHDYRIVYWTRPRLLSTPISWAGKPFEAIVRRDLLTGETQKIE